MTLRTFIRSLSPVYCSNSDQFLFSGQQAVIERLIKIEQEKGHCSTSHGHQHWTTGSSAFEHPSPSSFLSLTTTTCRLIHSSTRPSVVSETLTIRMPLLVITRTSNTWRLLKVGPQQEQVSSRSWTCPLSPFSSWSWFEYIDLPQSFAVFQTQPNITKNVSVIDDHLAGKKRRRINSDGHPGKRQRQDTSPYRQNERPLMIDRETTATKPGELYFPNRDLYHHIDTW